MAETLLDVRGLKCPLPVLKIQKAMKGLPAGGVLKVEATDPLAVIDVPAYCNEHGHALLSQASEGEVHFFEIEKVAG